MNAVETPVRDLYIAMYLYLFYSHTSFHIYQVPMTRSLSLNYNPIAFTGLVEVTNPLIENK